MSSWLVALLMALFLGFGSSTGSVSSPPDVGGGGSDGAPALPVGERTDFELHVSNQSFVDSPLPVTVEVDGIVVLDEALEVGSQHTWVSVPMSLGPGRHWLTVTSGTGTTLERVFRLPEGGMRHGVLSYWNYEDRQGRYFEWHVQRQPLAIM